MKKIYLGLLSLLCVSSLFAQNAVTLEKGLSGSVRHFEERIASGTRLVVLNFTSPSPRLSEYVMEELTVHFVNSNTFTMVDRNNLMLVQEELYFQLSGMISDETAQSVGRMLGAQSIVSGSIEPFADVFRLRVRVIDVESAAIQGIFTANIRQDRFLASLAGSTVGSPEGNAPSQQGTTTPVQAPSPDGGGSGRTGGRVSLPDFLR